MAAASRPSPSERRARVAGRHAVPRWWSHHCERELRASPTRGAPRARGCPEATRRELGADRSSRAWRPCSREPN
jgi:hypothetical protein